jgi:FkbM family methyltransferase
MVKSMRFASRNWHRRDWRKLQGRHLANLAREFPALIPEVARQAFSRLLAERRIPTVLPPMSANRLYLQYQTEQAPNRDSRLRLHAERDRFGMPRLEVDIRFLDIDIRTVEKLHELLAAQFRKSGAGVVHYEQSRVREAIRAHLSRFSSISHHLGGARMAENPREGVVDADCRVHSVDNLFVASSAVFPTGSQANPTLTILALALRLAEHLRARVKRENCSNQTDALENYVFAKDWYESAELKKLPTLLRGVRTFADVGASVGPYTKCANEILQNGRIVAIEANRSTFERLSANCRRWEAESSNRIEVIHGAAADKRGTIDFFIPGRNELPLTSSLIENTDTSETWRKETVPCVMLDELFAEASPDLVKLDVEGAEYRVLKGANRLLQLGQCKFLIEIHPWGDPGLGKTPADIFKLLYGVGYDFRLVARHWYFYKAPKSLKMAFKHAAIMVVMRNSWLKDALKKLAVAAGRAAAIRPHAGGS